ncbi:MbeD family mobilization/exclusion protein [Zymomonas mobilis]|uniref:MbeD family mobilization/exclusion protein n=1 Tax=Bacteria TaxID=2 RepID=UPI0025ABD784|nr:MbeD family mobilization/exclusion protein [Zymomonas mobilis]
MTELEQVLLNALENLQQRFDQQQKSLLHAQSELRQMFETTSTENTYLRQQVEILVERLNSFPR